MQQVDRVQRFWWRVPEASVAPDAVPDDPRECLIRQGWRLPNASHASETQSGARLAVSAADRSRYPRPRSQRSASALIITLAAGLLLVASAAGFIMAPQAATDEVRGAFSSRWTGLARLAGLGIDTVEISGQRQASENDILDAIDLANVPTLLALDWDSVRTRIERTPWVDRASMTFTYPSTLRIEVSERVPFAQWRRGAVSMLVDKTGRVLAEVQPQFSAGLPVISGEGAPEAAPALFKVLVQYPQLLANLTLAERIGERRWSLGLASGSRIELAPGAEADGLAMLAENERLARTIVSKALAVDYRARHRPTMRVIGPEKIAGLTPSRREAP